MFYTIITTGLLCSFGGTRRRLQFIDTLRLEVAYQITSIQYSYLYFDMLP